MGRDERRGGLQQRASHADFSSRRRANVGALCYLGSTNLDQTGLAAPAAFGGDSAVRLADGSVVLTCPASKEWIARTSGAQTRAAHPGTAVRWQDEIWEVVEAHPQAAGGTRYRLAPWDSRHAIRAIEGYDAASETARAGVRAFRRGAVRRRRLAILFSPVLGHLPGSVQNAMESEFGAPAAAMTIVSAAPFFLWGFLGLVAFIASMAGAGVLLPGLPPIPVAVYFTVESALRIASAVHGEPMGSAAGWALHALWVVWAARRPRA
jgi:hypothetical protein